MEFYTIGVYNTNENEFFEKLSRNNIDTFCDIRQRRAVRGSKYSFVNSNRLQQRLSEMGINYIHEKGLAPTKEIRELQKKHDSENQELKRDRKFLGQVFINEYNNQVINHFNFSEFLDELKQHQAHKIALFCVEEQHLACHRSLVANVLSNDFQFKITNL